MTRAKNWALTFQKHNLWTKQIGYFCFFLVDTSLHLGKGLTQVSHGTWGQSIPLFRVSQGNKRSFIGFFDVNAYKLWKPPIFDVPKSNPDHS